MALRFPRRAASAFGVGGSLLTVHWPFTPTDPVPPATSRWTCTRREVTWTADSLSKCWHCLLGEHVEPASSKNACNTIPPNRRNPR